MSTSLDCGRCRRNGIRVALAGCGLIGNKRAAALAHQDVLVGVFDPIRERAAATAAAHDTRPCSSLDELLRLDPEVVVVAAPHDQLAALAERVLEAGAHVLVEKPAGTGVAEIVRLKEAAEHSGRMVKVGFNHRFHPALSELAAETQSGAYGELMYLRACYGHGGRPGYEREWRTDPRRSGGGELVDQGMHLIDLAHWLAGPLPMHSVLLRTQFWDTEVEDNAALILGEPDSRTAPWALLHVSWTEWKNKFSIEAYCRTAKLRVDGLVHSYGNQRLRIYRMKPELGPPDLEERSYPSDDQSWSAEWEHFATAIPSATPLSGDLDDALYAWSCVERAYVMSPPYARMRASLTH